DFTASQGVVQVVLVDDAATGAVQQPHPILHLGDGVPVDDVARGVCERYVNGNEIGLVKNLLEIHEIETTREVRIRIDERIERNDLHAHGLALARNLAADAAKPDHTKRLARQLDTLELVFLTVVVFQRPGGISD